MTPETIMETVSESMGIDHSWFNYKGRSTKRVTRMRIIAANMMLIHCNGITLQEVANLLGKSNHTTVMYYLEQSMFLRLTEPCEAFIRDYEKVRNLLSGKAKL